MCFPRVSRLLLLISFFLSPSFALSGCGGATPRSNDTAIGEHSTAGDDDLTALTVDLERELTARADAAVAARHSGDPSDTWDACIETTAPAVLAARRELARALAFARSVGAASVMVDAEHTGKGADHSTELMVAFDLAALVGGGRAGATRARAEVEARLAEVKLDAARFEARHELERALARLAVSREFVEKLEELEAACVPTTHRLELLEGRGWLAPDTAAAARTMVHHVGAMRGEQLAMIADARAQVAAVSGLPPGSPWLGDGETTRLLTVTQRAWGRTEGADPSSLQLLEHHPTLRIARLESLAAEADVRIAAAEQWPALLIGPKAVLTPDDLLLGGVLRLELPWPPAASAAVDAARAERDAARDRLVTALSDARARVLADRSKLGSAEIALRGHAEQAVNATARGLTAATARFNVDPQALPEWTMAIDQRARALEKHSSALERWLIAVFNLSQARGERS